MIPETSPGSALVPALARPESLPPQISDVDWLRNTQTRARALAPNTLQTYSNQIHLFERWCAARELRAFPALVETLETYLNERAGGCSVDGHYHGPIKPSSLRVARAAISKAHRTFGYPDPAADGDRIRDTLHGLTNDYARAGGRTRQAAGLTENLVFAIMATAHRPRTGRGGRMETEAAAQRRGDVDIALVLVMRDCMLRRGEAAAAVWEDVSWLSDWDGPSPGEVPEGTGGLLHIPISKADQEGEGVTRFLAEPAMRALSSIRNGAADEDRIFGLGVAQIGRRIAAACRSAGLSGDFLGHSPRIGMAQDLARNGVELPALMEAGRWRESRMPARYTAGQRAERGAVAQYYAAPGRLDGYGGRGREEMAGNR